MKQKKDIFEVFQANEQVWDEMPSARAWERLEERLDKYQDEAKGGGMAEITVNTAELDKHQNEARRARFVRFRRLAVAASLLLVLGAASVMALQMQQAQQPQFAMNEYQTADLEDTYFTDAPKYAPVRYAKGSVINEGSPTSKLVAAVNYFYTDEIQSAQEEVTDLVLDTVKNVMHKILPSKRDFTWLLGDWAGKISDGTSLERWETTAEDTYEGRGLIVKNSDTLLMEQMRLQRKGENWYYILQSNVYTEPVIYTLSYYSPDFVIFKNPKVDFPNQIVLDRRLGEMYSTMFLPKHRIELTPRQLDFWLRRNVVLQDKAVRNLWKQI